MSDSNPDFIIVGAGTAALVLANHLSSHANISVLLLEAGHDTTSDPRSAIPALFSSALNSEMDWSYTSTPQETLNDRRMGVSQGKGVAGSTAINAEAVVFPSKADLDAWGKIGNEGWNWDALVPYFGEVFDLKESGKEVEEALHVGWAREFAGASKGKVEVSFTYDEEDPFAKAWVESFETLGHSLTGSPFSGVSTGAFNGASSVHATTRTRSSATGYLSEASGRENLRIWTGCLVQELITERGTGGELNATGVKYVKDGAEFTIHAKKEVIISAGAFGSPKLLELSGIGHPEILIESGIKVKVANPFVGTNLQDHLLTAISFEVRDGIATGDDLLRGDAAAIEKAMKDYQEGQRGPFASSGITSFAYLTATAVGIDEPTKESMLAMTSGDEASAHPLDSTRLLILRDLLQSTENGFAQYSLYTAQSATADRDTNLPLATGATGGNFVTIPVALAHPLSTGTSHIRSSNPTGSPVIDPNYLSHPLDLALHAHHVRYAETLASASPLSSLLKSNGKRNHPKAFIGDDLYKAEEFVRIGSTTNWHYVGTCAMAPKEKGGVVNSRLKVYGVEGLRVVDSSVIPIIPQSNTMSLVYAVAERAADLLKEDWKMGI